MKNMFFKILKWIKSIIRIFCIKLRYGKRISISFNCIKSVYIGRNVSIKINKGNRLVLGNKIYIDDYCRFECVGGDISIGDNTFFNTNNRIVSMERIAIGKNCLFGPNICIFDHNHKCNNSQLPISKQGFSIDKILIGNNIWIGANSTITKGIQIYDNVVVGANSIVTKKITKSGIYAGIPCRFVKSLHCLEHNKA